MDEEAYREQERWQIEIDDYRNRLMEIAQASPTYIGLSLHWGLTSSLTESGAPNASSTRIRDPSDSGMSGRSEGQHLEDLAASDDPVRVAERKSRARDDEHVCQV
jgi:hypothetical protein